MFDIWLGEINFTELILAVSVLVVLPVQLIICKKAKNKKLKFIPCAIFAALGIFCVVMTQVITGWDALGYLILAIYCAVLFLACIVGMLIYWICMRLKK